MIVMNTSWKPNQPAAPAEIITLKSAIDFDLPAPYVNMLLKFNGGEGEIDLPPLWLQLWSSDEVIANSREDIYKRDYPGCLFFASNGGMESLAMRKSSTNGVEIIMVDLIAGPESIEIVADDFDVFERALHL